MRRIVILLVMAILLAGCGEKEYFKQIHLSDVKGYMEQDEDGFLLVVNENDQDFQQYVKDVAESEEVAIGMYNVYESEEGAADKRPALPYDDFSRFNVLYYIEDNEVKGNLDVGGYEDMKLTEEIKHFIDLHK